MPLSEIRWWEWANTGHTVGKCFINYADRCGDECQLKQQTVFMPLGRIVFVLQGFSSRLSASVRGAPWKDYSNTLFCLCVPSSWTQEGQCGSKKQKTLSNHIPSSGQIGSSMTKQMRLCLKKMTRIHAPLPSKMKHLPFHSIMKMLQRKLVPLQCVNEGEKQHPRHQKKPCIIAGLWEKRLSVIFISSVHVSANLQI